MLFLMSQKRHAHNTVRLPTEGKEAAARTTFITYLVKWKVRPRDGCTHHPE